MRKRRERNSILVKVKHSHLQATGVTVTNTGARHRLEPVRILLRAVVRRPGKQRRRDGFRLGLILRPGQILQQRRIVPLLFQVLIRDRTFERAGAVAFQRGRASGGGQHRLSSRRLATGDKLLRGRLELRSIAKSGFQRDVTLNCLFVFVCVRRAKDSRGRKRKKEREESDGPHERERETENEKQRKNRRARRTQN